MDEYYHFKDDREQTCEFVQQLAAKCGYHPCGYGCYGEKLIEDEGKYYACWLHSRSCD